MINSLRKAINSLIFKVIIGIIILSFILSGSTSYLISSNGNYIAKVNKQKISFEQFENALIREYSYIKNQLSDRQYSEFISNRHFIKSFRQQIINRLIDEVLIEQYIKRLKLNISDEKIKETILSTQEFLSNGQFDNEKYNLIIKQMGISTDQYVHLLRKELLTQQVMNTIIDTDFMLSDETNKLVDLITQRRIVRESTIDVQVLSEKQKVSDSEIESYYEQNKDIFFSPEKLRINYIKLDAEMMKESVSNAEIESYYNQYQQQFVQSCRKHYSIIQTKTEEDAQIVLNELKNGADFSSIAKLQSVDIFSARNGGDIGWLEDEFIPDELKSADLREKNQLSGIIKSSVGYLVARLDDLKPAKIKPLNEVYDEILEKIKQKKRLNSLLEMKKKISSNAVRNNEEPLACAEKISGIKSIKTDWFSRDNLPEELNSQPIIDAIFKGNLVKNKESISNEHSNIILVDDGKKTFILYVAGYKPISFKPLKEVRDQIAAQFKRNKAIQQAKLDASQLLIDLKSGKGEHILKSIGLSFSKPKILSRTDDPINQKAFSLAPIKNKSNYGIANDINGNIVLLALDKVVIGKIPEMKRKEIIENIIQNYAQIIIESLMNNLRNQAKIKINNVLQ